MGIQYSVIFDDFLHLRMALDHQHDCISWGDGGFLLRLPASIQAQF
jgi:hypothetical protein